MFLYPNDATLREKILTVALRVYGAQAVEYDFKASRQLESLSANPDATCIDIDSRGEIVGLS